MPLSTRKAATMPEEKDGQKEELELLPAHAELLAALDRMLTTGSYYPPGHAQYQVVADQCAEAVSNAMGRRQSLEIEFTNTGVVVGGATVPKSDRLVTRLHDLIEPLNQALLEIKGGVTAEELHSAINTLKEYRKELSSSSQYHAITIEGMPENLVLTDRALYVKTRGGNGPRFTTSPLNEFFDPNSIPEAALVSSPDGQGLEREFLSVIRGLMLATKGASADDFREADDDKAEKLLGTWVPDRAIENIHQIVAALERTNSDPMMLTALIEHAQSAMKLTGDPDLVKMVFERLRKKNLIKPRKQRLLENRRKPVRKPTRFTLSRAELRALVDEVCVAAEQNPIEGEEELVAPAHADCLGVCLQVLNVAPAEDLAAGSAAMIYEVLASRELEPSALGVVQGALASFFAGGDVETIEMVVEYVTEPLRQAHPELLGSLWAGVWDRLEGPAERELAWPYAVNEILLGLKWEDPADKIVLMQRVSEQDTVGRDDLLERLEAMPALRDNTLAPNAFHAPAPLLYNVHRLLLGSSVADEHGPLLHRRLMFQKAHPLAAIIMDGMAEYEPDRRNMYEAILDQGLQGPIVPGLREVASRHLRGIINRLPPERRDERWVGDAIRWLGELGGVKADATLTRIVKEKKFLFFPVWPGPCRDAAREAIAKRAEEAEQRKADAEGDRADAERTASGEDVVQ
jgi:hypothetical protein